MAIDQRIQTTITAGRRGAHDADQGPIMVILLGCLAVAMCFTTLGMGFVNIARSASAAAIATKAREVHTAPVAAPVNVKPIPNPDAEFKRREESLRKQIVALQGQKEQLTGAEQEKKSAVESSLQSLSAERNNLALTKQELEALDASKKALAARVIELQAKLAGTTEAEQRQVQFRGQLEQQLIETKQQSVQTVRRIQELRESIEDKKNSLNVELVGTPDARPTVWVECTRAGIVVLPQGSRVSSAELSGKPEAYLKAIERRHVEFLIRPDGFHAFHAARDIAERHGASSYGYEPVDANWRLKYK